MKRRAKLRLGRFDIPRETILEDYGLATSITNGMVIFRAEMMLHKDTVEYMAISPLFDEVKEGEMIPDYEVIAEKIGDETKIKMKRRNV